MTVRKRRGGSWYFRKWVALPGGIKRRVFGTPGRYGLPNTKVACEEALRRAIGELLHPTPAQPTTHAAPSTTRTLRTFESTFIEFSDGKNKPSAVAAKKQILRTHILPALGSLPMASVTYAAIEDFKHDLAKSMAAKTVNNVLTVLHAMLAYAVKRGDLASVPTFEWLPVPTPPFDFLTFEEADRLVAVRDGEWSTMILIALRTGMRVGELLGLRWQDVDLVAGRLTVRQAYVMRAIVEPKNRKAREIPLSAQAVAALKAHRHLRGEHVFCHQDGSKMVRSLRPLERATARAGLRTIGWHVLRHTFASHLVMRGVPLNTVRELMGHQSIAQTLRYAHLAPEVMRDAVGLLDGGAQMVPNRDANSGTGRNKKA